LVYNPAGSAARHQITGIKIVLLGTQHPLA